LAGFGQVGRCRVAAAVRSEAEDERRSRLQKILPQRLKVLSARTQQKASKTVSRLVGALGLLLVFSSLVQMDVRFGGSATNRAMWHDARSGTSHTSRDWTGRCGSPHSMTHGMSVGFRDFSKGCSKTKPPSDQKA